MKKLILALSAVLCLALAACGISSAAGERPFRGLDAEDISCATVTLTPPDRTLRVEDTGRLAELLSGAVIYNRDDSYTEYAGQGVTFALTLSDGTELDVTAYNPFLIIDGTGYRTEYAPCEALSAYANELLNSGGCVDVLTEPPVLTVVSDSTALGALTGTYTWQSPNADGTYTGVASDSAHPLDCRELLSPLDTPSGTAALRFTVEPDEIVSAVRWSDADWGRSDAAGFDVPVSGGGIALEPGGWVYQVEARWDDAGGGYGTAFYCFYIVCHSE